MIVGEDGFDSEHDRAITSQGPLLEERCGITLGCRQGMVVANQNHVG